MAQETESFYFLKHTYRLFQEVSIRRRVKMPRGKACEILTFLRRARRGRQGNEEPFSRTPQGRRMSVTQ